MSRLVSLCGRAPSLAHPLNRRLPCLQIGGCFAPQDQGITFWQNASDASVAAAGLGVLSLEEGGDLEMLRDTYIKPSTSTCGSSVNSGTQSVTFSQVRHYPSSNINGASP